MIQPYHPTPTPKFLFRGHLLKESPVWNFLGTACITSALHTIENTVDAITFLFQVKNLQRAAILYSFSPHVNELCDGI